MQDADPPMIGAAMDDTRRNFDAIPIRVFQSGDAQEVIALWTEVFGYSAPHNEPTTILRLKQEAADGLLFVAVVGEGVVGTVMGGYDGHRGWIYSLAVRPDAQGSGIGTALMQHVEEALKARGCLKINLQVLASNTAVTAFYASLGYKIEERVSMGKLL